MRVRPEEETLLDKKRCFTVIRTIVSGDTGIGGTRVHAPGIFPCRDPGVRSDYGVRNHGQSGVLL